MAGCQYPAGSPGPQGIGGDGGIAQTGHQQSPFRGQQCPQALPEQGGFLRTGEGSFPDGIGFQGDIASRRFADGPGAGFVQNSHSGQGQAMLFGAADLNAGKIRFPGQIGSFQGKVSADHGKISLSFR